MAIVTPSFNYIQQPSIQFNNPVSESSLAAMGGTINGLLSVLLPVGSVMHTMLTEAQWQTQMGNNTPPYYWVLADGRSVVGSLYNTITGLTNVPDLRSVFLRGKDNGRGLNPNGELAVGTYTADKYGSHSHTITDPSHTHTTTASYVNYGTGMGIQSNQGQQAQTRNTINSATTGITINTSGGNETASKSVIVNIMIRIN
jgi:microcystin-dependent protein